MTRLALFDIDGTLIRTGGAGVRAFERTAAAEFSVADGVRDIKFAGRTDWSLVREFFGRHQIEATPSNFRRFFERFVFVLDEQMQHSNGGPCAGVVDFLEALRALPAPPLIGLLTGNIRLGAEIKLRRFGLWDWFVTGAFGDDHEDRNQLAALARDRGGQLLGHSLSGVETLVIGDTSLDIQCGRAIGARVLAVATGGATLAQLQAQQPDWAVESLEQIDAQRVCA